MFLVSPKDLIFGWQVQAGKTSLAKTRIDRSSFEDGVEANVIESFTIYSKGCCLLDSWFTLAHTPPRRLWERCGRYGPISAFFPDVVSAGGDDVKVYITQGNSITVAQVDDNTDGTYDVSFSVTKAGDYTVTLPFA